jgi:hypothetical protein
LEQGESGRNMPRAWDHFRKFTLQVTSSESPPTKPQL